MSKQGGYSFNGGKSHNGQWYTGMKVGGSHHWTYSDASWTEERSIASAGTGIPELMQTGTGNSTSRALRAKAFQFDAVKTRVRKAPIKSGAKTGTGYHWFFVSQMDMRKNPGSNSASKQNSPTGGAGGAPCDSSLLVTIRGDKFKVGHKRPDWSKWSYDQGSTRSAPQARCEFVESEIALLPKKLSTSKEDVEEKKEQKKKQDLGHSYSALLSKTFPSWQCTEIIWNETKRTPDRWSVFVQFQMSPPITDDCSATPNALIEAFNNQKFLIVAEQLATKLNANAYQTSMHGERFHLGRIGEDTSVAQQAVLEHVKHRFEQEAQQHRRSTAPLVGKKRKQLREDSVNPDTSAAAPLLLDALRKFHEPVVNALNGALSKAPPAIHEEKDHNEQHNNPKLLKKRRVTEDVTQRIIKAVETYDFTSLMELLKANPQLLQASMSTGKVAVAKETPFIPPAQPDNLLNTFSFGGVASVGV